MTSIADRYDYSCKKRHTAPRGCQKSLSPICNHFLPAISSFIIKSTHTTKATFDLLEFYKLSCFKFWLDQNIPKYFDTWRTVQGYSFLLKNQSFAKEESASCIFLHNCNYLKYLKSTFWKSLKTRFWWFFSSIIWKL